MTGDVLLSGGVGKTWEPGAFEELLGDVSSQLFGVYGVLTLQRVLLHVLPGVFGGPCHRCQPEPPTTSEQ